jgi:hypothetical protein
MNNKERIRRASKRNRRGSLYLQVVMVSTLVSLMGLTAVAVSRIRRRVYESGAGASQARYYAQSAIRMAFHRIEADPNWRFTYSSGAWETNTSFADGTFSIEGVDPTDGDLSDDPEDPVVITGIGTHGASVHRVEVTISPTRNGLSCLQRAMHASLDVKLGGGTLYCNQLVSSNEQMNGVNSSDFHCDVEAVTGTSGGTFHGNVNAAGETRELPAFPDVLDYYQSVGTAINKNDLDTSYPQVIRNSGFESGTAEWDGNNCAIEIGTGDPYEGTNYLRVIDRASATAGVDQLITNVVAKDKQVTVKAWLRTAGAGNTRFRFRLEIETDLGTSTIDSPSALKLKATDPWTLLSRRMTPTWTGTLQSIKLRIVNDGTADYFADAVTLQQKGNDKCIVGKLLSPNHNPYGDPNPDGIYLLDMADEKVFINFSRIYGTLVLINPKAGSTFGEGGTMVMEPAKPGLPAIICSEKELKFKTINVGLVESQWQTNFNPTGAPYDGVTDSDTTDTYTGEIKGLILGEKKIKFEQGYTKVTGSIYSSTDKVEVKNGTLDLTHDTKDYLNPPPGFVGPETIRILLQSAKRPVD